MTDIAISVKNLSKCFQVYETPRDRLKQFVLPRLQRFARKQPRQYYREFWALKDVSLEIKKGETLGIVGRNGSGKSTLLQIICGTLTPTSGSVQTNGRIAALLELGSGFNPEFTGRENIYMNAAVLGLSKDEIDARYNDIVTFADIGDFIEQPVKTYSSGMAVRLAFAVAINVDPEILIVDEALSVGDELFQRKCFSRIQAIKKSGASILLVSHSGAQIVELCDRALLLDAGEGLRVGAPKLIIANYHKLLHAHKNNREVIRQEIRDEMIDASYSKVSDQSSLKNPELEQETTYIEEYLDPYLKPSTAIEFDQRGAEIRNVRILTADGKHVNALVRGRRYVYSYQVTFSDSAESVRFGMAINTTNGIFLGGAYSVPLLSKSIPYIKAGTTINVEFSFNCYLNVGIYYTNAGVYGVSGGEEILMYRIMDAAAFRVIPVEADSSTGTVWFSADFNLTN